MFYGQGMGRPNSVKTWSKTSVSNLVRHRNGGYYARLFRNGKESWKSLKTKVLEVAKSKLRDEQATFQKQEPVVKVSKSGRMTVASAIAELLKQVQARVPMRRKGRKSAITESSAHYRRQTVEALRKTWNETVGTDFDALEVRRVAGSDVQTWADKYRARVSSTRFNNTLGTLRRIFDLAIAAGELHRNPAQDVSRSYKDHRETYTPTREEFVRLVAAMRASESRYAGDAADFVEFCAYTGARKNEAAHVVWGDVDLARERITFRETKNGHIRTNELIAPALELLRRIQGERPETPSIGAVFRVSEAYGSLRAAAKAIGIPHISHHDLRDLFATTAIESGVDIPTVADWLGHKDGGALLLERYRKRRDEHAKASAKRVSFAPIAPSDPRSFVDRVTEDEHPTQKAGGEFGSRGGS